MSYCKKVHPLRSLDLTSLDCQTLLPRGPQRDAKTAPRDHFQDTLALGSGQTLDRNALAGAQAEASVKLLQTQASYRPLPRNLDKNHQSKIKKHPAYLLKIDRLEC